VRFCRSTDDDIKPYLAYDWVDGPTWLTLAQQVFGDQTVTTRSSSTANVAVAASEKMMINICFIGDSHSRGLYASSFAIFRDLGTVPWLAATYVFALFPPLFDAAMLDEHHCSVAVFSFAIWPLSSSPVPYTSHLHKAQMQDLLERVRSHGSPTQIYTRSENINGLGFFASYCPSTERRTPLAFDALNTATREVSEAGGVPFIDLDHINYPMWDSGLDFCHPPVKVFEAERDYILHELFTHALSKRTVVPTFPVSRLNLVYSILHNAEQQMGQVKLMEKYYKGKK
jgi:hypothetical protein